ncbi:hypothetical protein [Endozoicomonas sp. OPT23]|uniref:hypothetical protein n=1 Tax=Endozoicomonas sp. OPT23 TaxID=2072845 RepID=UPI00189187AC|nr:hypothetical protein [Endozoicomonas sp. OPT23]
MFWKVVGVFLLGWVGWDLFYGYTYLFDVVYRDQDPTLYWVAVSGWTLLGISCFFSWD